MAARRKRTTAATRAQAEFVSEAEEILERMRDDFGVVAESIATGSELEAETVNGLFRSAHSLKGLSGMFGHESMSELAHHLEDILDQLRMGRAVLDRPGLALFDEAVSLASTALEKVGDGDAAPALAEDITDLIGRIENWNTVPAAPAETEGALAIPESMLRALTEYEEHRLRENLERGRGIYLVEAAFEIASFEEPLHELQGAIREVGEVLSTLPSPSASMEAHICFSILAATDLGHQPLADRLDLGLEAIGAVRLPGGAPTPSAMEAPEDDADLAAGIDPSSESGTRSNPGASPRSNADAQTLRSVSDTVRVNIRKLDDLMNLVGELAVQRGTLSQIVSELSADPGTHRIAGELRKFHKSLERKLQELQVSVLDVRMVPLRQVFDKLSRVARRLRLDLEKDVRIEINGADTELDKLIVEQLVDPLMHLIRNAFDHAIEPGDEREAAGKPAEGCVVLSATQRGNDVVITVTDDGRGIDVDKVRAKAIETGLISEAAELGRREVLDLIFHPGLSTREEVTETSGRGVGMDVVRSNIAALGGLVEIESDPGRGTTMRITLPITLAIIQALTVRVGDHRFAIPLNSIRETLLVESSELQRSEGRELINLRGDALPLRRLSDEFGLEAPGAEKLYVVVLGLGDMRLGLLVDRLEGQQDTVIKPIQGPVAQVRGIAGATETGDGSAVLVLDVSALIEDVVRKGDAS